MQFFFYCGVYFCLHGGNEHRQLTLSFKEVTSPIDNAKMVKCVVYMEHGSKNRKEVIHQVHLDNKVVTHYADSTLGKRCFVYLMELYVSKLSDVAKEKDLFI